MGGIALWGGLAGQGGAVLEIQGRSTEIPRDSGDFPVMKGLETGAHYFTPRVSLRAMLLAHVQSV